MEREKLKNILEKHYSKDSVKSILSGRMTPKYKVLYKLYIEEKIPLTAWSDIKTYISNSTECNKNTQV